MVKIIKKHKKWCCLCCEEDDKCAVFKNGYICKKCQKTDKFKEMKNE